MTARRKPKVGGARAGAGRPPKGPSARSVVRTIKLTPAERDAQDALAASEGTKWTDVARAALGLVVARGSTR